MLNAWFYSHPSWEVTIVVCLVLVLIGLGGLFLVHRLVHWEAREKDTTMVGLSYALAGGIYAIVISFVAVGVYENMDKGEAIASAEANSLSSLVFDSAGLPAELGLRIREGVYGYVDTVTKKEWPDQQAFHMKDANFETGWSQLRKISLDLASYQPITMGQATVKSEMLSNINELFSQRRGRLLAANAHLPDAVWQMMIVGLILTIAYICLFGPHNFKVHMGVVTLTMAAIGLVFSLIIALDYPFRGDLSVDDDAYVGVKEIAASVFEPAESAKHEGGAESPAAAAHEKG